MKRTVTAAIVVLLVSGLASAQSPEPPKELGRLDRLLGHWVGKGTAQGGPDGPSMPWTSRSTVTKVLGGHFLRDDMVIEFSQPAPMTLAFRNYLTYDATKKRYLIYSVSNAGDMKVQEMHWLGDDAAVQVDARVFQGKPMIERWTTKFGKGTQTYHGQEMGPTGGAFTHVEGSAKRVKDAKPVDLSKVGGFMAAPGDEMKRLHRMVGDYEMTGKYAMQPGQEMVPFTGQEKVRALFGGLVLENHASGDGYEGYGLMVWDARDGIYRRINFNSWGMHGQVDGFWSGDTELVMLFKGDMMGQHMITRSVFSVDAKGRFKKGFGHTMVGHAPPFSSFTGTYKPAPSKGN